MKKLLLVLLAFLPGLAFAQVKISALPAAGAQTGVEILPEVQSATTKGATVNQIQTYIFGDVSSDCTATSGGALTCAKTNGTAFGIWATGTHVCADLTNSGNGCSGTLPVGGNPSANVSTSATNGSSANFMRADAAPAIDQTMAPTMSGHWTFSSADAASSPAVYLTGTISAGGTGTTNFPLFFVQPSTATASTTWSTSGTAIGVNAHSGAIGNLLDVQVDGTSEGSISSAGLGLFLDVSNGVGNSGAKLVHAFGITIGTSGVIAFTNGNQTGTSQTYLSQKAAASLQQGATDAAAPIAQTLGVQSVVAGTTNTAGANWTFNGSASTGSGVGGSLIFKTSLATAGATSQNSFQTVLTLDGNQHVSSGGVAPAVSSCGGGSPSVSGTDVDGAITIGTTATACTLTFHIAYAAAPHCVVQDISTVAHLTSYTVGTGTIVLTMTSNSGDVVEYICHGA